MLRVEALWSTVLVSARDIITVYSEKCIIMTCLRLVNFLTEL